MKPVLALIKWKTEMGGVTNPKDVFTDIGF